MALSKLSQMAKRKSPFCAGIDIRDGQVPTYIREKHANIPDRLLEYGKLCIDAAEPYACACKIQVACYEAYGVDGMRVFSKLCKYAREAGILLISDIKRGDIGSTAELYARAHFAGDFEADIVTLSPYMGEDAISPYYPYMSGGRKGAFLLAKTSNPSSGDFQDLETQRGKVYLDVLNKILEWARSQKKDRDFSPIGAVVAVNEAVNIDELREVSKDLFLLVPGYGAQGASLADIKNLIGKYQNGIVSVSRGYTANHALDLDEIGIVESLQKRARQLSLDIRECY